MNPEPVKINVSTDEKIVLPVTKSDPVNWCVSSSVSPNFVEPLS